MQGWSRSKNFRAFSLVRKDIVFPYNQGIAEGWDNPDFANKVSDPFTFGILSEQEADILTGINLMKRDQLVPKICRGG